MTTMTNQAPLKSLRYIDAVDLPSDVNGSLGDFRRAIRMAYNTNRGHRDKLVLLANHLRLVLTHIEYGLGEADKVDQPKAIKKAKVVKAKKTQALREKLNKAEQKDIQKDGLVSKPKKERSQ
jgi:hypothetical protein